MILKVSLQRAYSNPVAWVLEKVRYEEETAGLRFQIQVISVKSLRYAKSQTLMPLLSFLLTYLCLCVSFRFVLFSSFRTEVNAE